MPDAAARPPRQAAVAFIFAVVVIDMLALGMIVPVLPTLVKEFQGGDTVKAAEVLGVFGVAWALMQFLFSPLAGALSDRFGRRPVLLGSLFGHAADFLFMALAPSVAWLFVGRVISGVLAATISTASAYIADITPPDRRAAAFGMVSAAWGLGFVIGPALGGFLGAIDPRLPFWVAAGLAAAAFVFGLVAVPESLPREKRARLELKKANPLGALGLLRSSPKLQGLAAVYSLNALAFNALPSVFVLYAGHRYGWGEMTVGLTLGAVGLTGVIVSSLVVRPAVKRLGERRALLAGLMCTGVGYAIYALAPTGALFWVGVPIAGLGQIYGAAMMSLMSQTVGPSVQGRLQGATSSLMGLTGVIGPAVFLSAFAWAISPHTGVQAPGLPFLIAGALIAAAWAIAWRVTRPEPPEPPEPAQA